jgi:hypothetical protein
MNANHAKSKKKKENIEYFINLFRTDQDFINFKDLFNPKIAEF